MIRKQPASIVLLTTSTSNTADLSAIVDDLRASGFSARVQSEPDDEIDENTAAILIHAATADDTPPQIALCRRLHAALPDTPILMILPDNRLVDAALLAGAEDYALTSDPPPLLTRRLRQQIASHHDHDAQLRLIEHLSHPMLICRASTAVIRHLNPALASLLGYEPVELIGQTVFDLAERGEHDTLRLLLHDARHTPAQVQEVALQTATGDLINVSVLLDWLDAHHLLMQFEHRSVPVPQSVATDPEKYRQVFNATNDAILVVELQTEAILDANIAATQLFGYSYEELTLNTQALLRMKTTSRSATTYMVGRSLVYETDYRRKDGRIVPVEVSAQMIRYDGYPAFVSVIRDISRRRASEKLREEQRLLLDALRQNAAAISQTLELRTVLGRILEGMQTVMQADRMNVILIENGMIVLVCIYEHDSGLTYIEEPRPFEIERWEGLKHIAENRDVLYIPDTRQYANWSQTYIVRQYISYIGAPLMIDDQVIGFINIDGAQVNQFTPQQADYLRAFATQASIAIRNARLYESVQKQAQKLEQRVAERTEELSAERNLLRTLIDTLPDPIYIKDGDGRFTLVNAAALAFVQRARPDISDLIGLSDYDFMPAQVAEGWRQQELDIFRTGKPLIDYEHQSINPETGDPAIYLISKVPLTDANGKVIAILGINHDITQLRRAQDEVAQIAAGANCLLWYATVSLGENQRYQWSIHIPDEASAQRFLPIRLDKNERYGDAWQHHMNPDDLTRLLRVTHEALSQGRSEYVIAVRISTINNSERWINFAIRVTPLVGNRWRLIGVCTDVTAQKQLEDTLRRNNEMLERRVLERTARYVQSNEELIRQIAERERITEALRASEERYRTLANQLPVGVYQTDPRALFQYVNRAMAEMLGYGENPEALLGISAFDFYADADEIDRQLERAAQHREGIRVNEIRLKNRHGDVLWVRNTWQAIRSDEGKVTSFGGVIEDITERKQAQEAEQAQRQLAEALSAAAADLNSTLELDKVLDRILDHIKRVLPPFVSSSILLIEPNDRVHVIRYRRTHGGNTEDVQEAPRSTHFDFRRIRNLVRIHETGQPVVVPDTHNSPNWQTDIETNHWVRSYLGSPITIDGEVVGFINLSSDQPNTFGEEHAQRVMAFANQVGTAIKNARLYNTVQRYAESLREQVEQRTAELHKQTRLLDAILNSMTEGVTYFDFTEGRLVFSNRALVHLTGYTEDELIQRGNVISLFNLAQGMTPEYVRERIREIVIREGLYQMEGVLTRKDRTTRHARVVVTPLSDGDILTGLVTVIRDISQEKALEEERRKFIAYASHELRTPISNLNMRVYLMRKQPEKLDHHMDILETVIFRMRQLTEDLLDLSRLESGSIKLKRQTIDMQGIVSDVMLIHSPEAERKSIALIQDFAPEPVMVSVDVSRFSRVLINLLTNAINYTPEGGTVTFEVKRDETHAIVRVRDDGPGIAPDILPDIFKLFVRGRNDGVGSGLGLTIAKELVEAHKGTIEVESEIGKGTVFTVRLTLAEC